jgi:hypothetical protein
MATATSAPKFSGPFKDLLAELAELMDWLWSEHGLSFVKAGDDKVYAFGGNGNVLVFDESKWNGLIEFITPKGGLSIKPGEDGKITVDTAGKDDKTVKAIFREGIDAIRSYYRNRYWVTPNLA